MKATLATLAVAMAMVGCVKQPPPQSISSSGNNSPNVVDNKGSVTVTTPCVAGPDETCPSDLWMADYDRLMSMRARYQAPQDVTDQMNGMDARLARDIPPGYYFNVPKKRFVKLPPSGAAAAPTTK
jgi:hypothetical protein